MRVLYVFCHPLSESFHTAIQREAVVGLRTAGHNVDLFDLYAEGFNPVLSAHDRRIYDDKTQNRSGVESYIQRLTTAEALIVEFPTWCFGPPAMLKGFLDRILLPGVAFDMSNPRKALPLLQNITKLVGIVTYGRPRLAAIYMGDPPRKMVTRYLRWFIAPAAKVRYYALYNMNVASEVKRHAFVSRMREAMVRL